MTASWLSCRKRIHILPLLPPEMREWRELVHPHRLEMHFPLDQILAVSLQLVSAGFPMPSNLDEVNLSELHAMASLSPSPVAFMAVRSSNRAVSDALSSDGEYLVPAHELFTNDDLARAIRRHSALYASSGSIDVRAKRKLRAPRTCCKMCHAQRIRLMGSSAGLPRTADRYIKDATHANVLKPVKGFLPGMASAFR